MKTLQIDHDLYTFIASQTREVGEGASPILRRLLGLPASNGRVTAVPAATDAAPSPPTAVEGAAARDGQVLAFVASPEFRAARNPTQRFLAMLGFAYREDPAAFERTALSLRGRTRTYYARTRQELDRSGQRLHPHPIPGSSLWAMTNASTYQKGQMLRELLTALGYGWPAVLEATRALG